MEPNGANGRVPRKPYPAEIKERSVRMVLEHRAEYASELEAIKSIAGKMGMHKDTLKDWVRQAIASGDQRRPPAVDERERLKQLERENRELRRANEILKSASVFSRSSSTVDSPGECVHRGAQEQVRGRADL